jgi:hypothetical protein
MYGKSGDPRRYVGLDRLDKPSGLTKRCCSSYASTQWKLEIEESFDGIQVGHRIRIPHELYRIFRGELKVRSSKGSIARNATSLSTYDVPACGRVSSHIEQLS